MTCQPGFEDLLGREVAASGQAPPCETGAGWILLTSEGPSAPAGRPDDWCFAHLAAPGVIEVKADSVNSLASGAADHFFATAVDERFDGAWPLMVAGASGESGLGRRASAVEAEIRERLRRRMARVARLASPVAPRGGTARGLFVFLADFGRAFVGRAAWFGGQRRMADDPAAPSRSYLKVEEAYGILGQEPGAGQTVADLGAAPGGWSYSAAARAAAVTAVDNGPLKGGAAGHPRIAHRREDAFGFRPPPGGVFDWLFCDLVEEPHHVLRAIVLRWLGEGWCRRFVVNLKFGRADAIALLAEARSRTGPLCRRLVVRHLFHDRDEFTLMGESAAAGDDPGRGGLAPPR